MTAQQKLRAPAMSHGGLHFRCPVRHRQSRRLQGVGIITAGSTQCAQGAAPSPGHAGLPPAQAATKWASAKAPVAKSSQHTHPGQRRQHAQGQRNASGNGRRLQGGCRWKKSSSTHTPGADSWPHCTGTTSVHDNAMRSCCRLTPSMEQLMHWSTSQRPARQHKYHK